MSRIKLGILATLLLLCVGQAIATAAAVAASEGELVNSKQEALTKNKYTSSGGTTAIETVAGTKIICKSSTAHGIWTSKTGGELTVLFKECGSSGLSCKGGKDESGEPKAGEVFILFGLLIKRSNATERLILYTIHRPGTLEAGELELVCSGVKILLRGSFLGTTNYKTKVLSKTIELSFTQSKGKQAVTEYENEKGEKVKCKGLEAKVESGAFEGAALEGKETDTLEEEAQFL